MIKTEYDFLKERCNYLENKIKELEDKINTNLIPNQDLLILRNNLISIIQKISNIYTIKLQAGACSFCYTDLIEMIDHVGPEGNFYILLVGNKVNRDINLWYFLESNNIDKILNNLQVKKIYDTRINENEAFLIALHNFNDDIDNKKIIKFVRK